MNLYKALEFIYLFREPEPIYLIVHSKQTL